jgi:FkbM family methyltransferase
MITFGVSNGIYVFCQVEILRKDKIRLPGYPFPIFLRPDTSDLKVFREVFLFCVYNFNIGHNPEIIVDGGANIGLSSVFFAKKYKNAKIYAVEPEGTNLGILRKNVNGYEQIVVVPAALWNRDCQLRIKNLNENKWAFTVEDSESENNGAITGISFSTLILQYHIRSIDLLKLDIEGSERALFNANHDLWIPFIKSMIIELHDWLDPECSDTFVSAVANYHTTITPVNGLFYVVFHGKK